MRLSYFGGSQSECIIFMESQEKQLQISIFTFTHDYYQLQLPPQQRHSFYHCFPQYRHRLDFRGQHIKTAPVVRIYGTSKQGEKCCCHIHGFFPFLYIKTDQYTELFSNVLSLNDFLLQLEASFKQAFRYYKPVIYKGELEERLDFYGYHTKPEVFLKLSLYDPPNVVKMRELLSSGVVCGKNFQCYQAHINYYMQFFSEFNVYGINQMKISGFTFRRNYPFMPLFRKLTIPNSENKWDLTRLEIQRPQCFNSLAKTSSCYIEIDLDHSAILNAHQLQESQDEEFASSDEELFTQSRGIRKLKVTVTKALQQIWRDQRKRRSRFKIRKAPQGLIDLSKNVQSTHEVQNEGKDPLWINFISKGDNVQQVLELLRSYKQSSPQTPASAVVLDLHQIQNYQQSLAQQRQDLIRKVQGRFHFYEQRKNTIIKQITNGDRAQLPEWSDEQSQDDDDQSGKSQDSNISNSRSEDNYTFSKQGKHQVAGNTVKYRNNFKFQMAGFKAKSLFKDCKYCRVRNIDCLCDLCEYCDKEKVDCTCKIVENNIQQIQSPEQYELLQFEYNISPPLGDKIASNIAVQYQKPYYSNLEDLYQHYNLGSSLSQNLKTAQCLDKQLKNTSFFNREPISIKNHLKLPYFYQNTNLKQKQTIKMNTFQLQYSHDPPSYEDVLNYNKKQKPTTGIRGTTTNKFQDTFIAHLLVFNYELIVEIPQKGLYYGNPQKHPIISIVFQLYNEQAPAQSIKGAIILQKYMKNHLKLDYFDEIFTVKTQASLLSLLINIIFRVDIDIFVSWDMQKKGLRYLLQRGIMNDINMSQCLSRSNDLEHLFEHINFIDYKTVKETYLKRSILTEGNIMEEATARPSKDNSRYLSILEEKLKKRLNRKPVLRQKYLFDMEVKGRVNINLCRICEMELKLRSYTLEAVVSHIYKTQIPDFTDKYLCNAMTEDCSKVIDQIGRRIQYEKLITHELNIIGGIVEKSKIYGADFLSMMERGSQFKIESIMCRTAKQNNYLTLSATKGQVGAQSLLLCRPLVLQPPKQFYTQPVLLFDFQSLYPSVMIAYNLCYSTCLGSIKQLFKDGKVKRLGVSSQITVQLEKLCELIDGRNDEEQLMKSLSNYVFVTPNRVAFVRKSLKQGIIPKILLQFLISRIMIKNSAKLYTKESIKSILKQRQMALKLFMNVMFGYTGASFSGRMPCSQIADSVVQVSKYCLRKSIDYLNNHPKYKGKVLYGDTDSIFFHLPNHKFEDTFGIGKQLAEEITKMFPYPMEMKFQKVYQSLFLVSKKRYYGKSYETADSQPKYEGKGLQTVRRDGIPFTSDIMAKLLNKLIDTKDLSQMKMLLHEQSRRLLIGNVNISELCLAKQVKLLKYTQKNMPAHGQAAKRLQNIDIMLLPRYGQRLKYLVVEGGEILRQRAIPLFEYMLHQEKYHLDLNYYYTKLFLPPLRRALISLVNIDQWGATNLFFKEVTIPHNHFLAKGELVCLKCLDEFMKESFDDSEKTERTCLRCVSSGLDSNSCVEWNCNNLYNRKKYNDSWRFIKEKGQQLRLIKKILNC